MEFTYTPAVNAAKENDEAAFNFLYNKSYPILKREALKYVANELDADDILQNTYVSIFKNIGSLKEPEKFMSWSLTICRNLCINECKRQSRINSRTEFRRESSEEEDDGIDSLPASAYDLSINPEAAMDAGETKRLLDEMIGDLPPMQRTCIMLWQEEFSVKEISEKVMIPEGTVKSNVNYAKKKIKEKVLHLEKQGTKLYGLAPIPFFLWLLNQYETIYFPESIAEGAVGSFAAVAKGLHASISEATVSQGASAAKGIASYDNAAGAAKSFAAEASKKAAAGGLKKAGISTLAKAVIGVSAAAMTIGGVAGARMISNQRPQIEIQADEGNTLSIDEANDVSEDLSQPDRAGEGDLSESVTASDVVQTETQKTPEEQYNNLLNNYVDFFAGEIPYTGTDISGFVGERDDRLIDVSGEDTAVYLDETGIYRGYSYNIDENTRIIDTDAEGYFVLNGSRSNYFEEASDNICYALYDIDGDGKNECLLAKRVDASLVDYQYYYLIELWTTDADGQMEKVSADPYMLTRKGQSNDAVGQQEAEQSQVLVYEPLEVSPEGSIYIQRTSPNGRGGRIQTYQISNDKTLELKLDAEFYTDTTIKELGYRINGEEVSREEVFGGGTIVWNTLKSFAGFETAATQP